MFKVNLFGVFIVNFEHIPQLVLVFILITLSKQVSAGITYYFQELIIEKLCWKYEYHKNLQIAANCGLKARPMCHKYFTAQNLFIILKT